MATATTVLAKPPPDDLAVVEQPLAAASSSSSSSHHSSATDNSSVHTSKPSKNLSASRIPAEGEPAHLSPSLIPAPQPTISLLSSDSTDTLSVDSLTLVPPVDPDSILAVNVVLQASTSEADACAETGGDGHLSHPSDTDGE